MRDELEQALAGEFPFMRRGLSAKEQKRQHGCVCDSYSAWGLEMGEGWFALLRSMCAEITEAYAAAGEPVDLVVDQVKEKFGTLRFYWHPQGRRIAVHALDDLAGGSGLRTRPGFSQLHRKVHEIVSKYEEMSACVCERCGAPGRLRTDLGWAQTLCDVHDRERHAAEERRLKPEKNAGLPGMEARRGEAD